MTDLLKTLSSLFQAQHDSFLRGDEKRLLGPSEKVHYSWQWVIVFVSLASFTHMCAEW